MSDELDELKSRYERLKLLHQVNNVIHSTLDPRTALRLILGEAVRLIRASSGSVSLFNATTGFLEIEASHGLPVPLEVNGEVRGVLNVDSDRLNAFSAADQELLHELSFQAARVIHNTWLYEQLRLKARLFEGLVSVGQTINSTLNLDDALRVITREACQPHAGKRH